jgi:hypothetical protein
MRRRALLRGAATAGAGGVLALVGLRVSSQPADAQASAGLDVGDESATVGPDGSVTALASASASDTPTLTVERSGYDAEDYGSVGGSGSLTIETE